MQILESLDYDTIPLAQDKGLKPLVVQSFSVLR